MDSASHAVCRVYVLQYCWCMNTCKVSPSSASGRQFCSTNENPLHRGLLSLALVLPLFAGCGATNWFGLSDVQPHDCLDAVPLTSDRTLRDNAAEDYIQSSTEVDANDMEAMLFGPHRSDEFIDSLRDGSSDSQYRVAAATVVVDKLSENAELSDDDKRTVLLVLASAGVRSSYSALKKHDKAARLQQIQDVGVDNGVGERFAFCAAIGEKLFSNEREILDIMIKTSGDNKDLSTDSKARLLSMMLVRGDDILATLSDSDSDVFDSTVRVGSAVTEERLDLGKFTKVLADTAAKDMAEAPSTPEESKATFLRIARALAAANGMLTRGGQRDDVSRTFMAHELVGIENHILRDTEASRWRYRKVLPDFPYTVDRDQPSPWNQDTASGVYTAYTRHLLKHNVDFPLSEQVQQQTDSLAQIFSNGKTPAPSDVEKLTSVVQQSSTHPEWAPEWHINPTELKDALDSSYNAAANAFN